MSGQRSRTTLEGYELSESQRLLGSALTGGRLPRWGFRLVAVGATALALLLNLATPVAGVAGTLIVAILLFLALQTLWSFRVEGRRHAVDRLATSAVYATFVVALVPLVSVLFTVVSKGISALSAGFLTTSMRNVSPSAEGRR